MNLELISVASLVNLWFTTVMDNTNTSALQRAADQVGVPAIANACSISVQAVYKWLRKGQAPAERCEAISRITGGRIAVLDLLPPALRAAVAPAANASRRATDPEPAAGRTGRTPPNAERMLTLAAPAPPE